MRKRIFPIDIDKLIDAHDTLLKTTGGELGILNSDGLFDLNKTIENHYYFGKKTLTELSAYVLFILASNHYFVDGNKRAALLGFVRFVSHNFSYNKILIH